MVGMQKSTQRAVVVKYYAILVGIIFIGATFGLS